MVATIKKGASKEELKSIHQRVIENSSNHKKFDAHKFCGAVKFSEDGLKIQKKH